METATGKPLNHIHGTDGDDVIHGTPGRDGIDALAGDDRVFAGAGGDVILGREGDDHIVGGGGDDDLQGSGLGFVGLLSGNDELHGGAGNDTVTTSDGRDLVSLGAGDDVVFVSEATQRTEITDLQHGRDGLVIDVSGSDGGHSGLDLDTNGDGRIDGRDADVRAAHGGLVVDLAHFAEREGGEADGPSLLVLDHVDHLAPLGDGTIEIG